MNKKIILLPILAAVLFAAGCQAESDITDNSPAPTAEATQQAATEAVIASPTATEKAVDDIFMLDRELDTQYSLINDRLTIMMPEGTIDRSVQYGVMSAPESSQRLTLLYLESGNKNLAIWSVETFT